MEEIELSWWLFEGRLGKGKNVLPDGLNWLCYFKSSSKSRSEKSISFIFLESPHQVDMKIVFKYSKHFLGYFHTLETHSDSLYLKEHLPLKYTLRRDQNTETVTITKSVPLKNIRQSVVHARALP